MSAAQTSTVGRDLVAEQPGCIGLDWAGCMERLASTKRGRMAITVGALPTIVPVCYTIVDDQVRFPVMTDEAWRATDGHIVAFNAEGVDAGDRLWSVGVLGRAHHLASPDARLVALSIERLKGHREA
jgi:hypothetical protein